MYIFQENIDFQNVSFERSVTKKELRIGMKISSTTFGKMLSELELEIIGKFPKYNKNCSILNPRIARFIVDSFGYDIVVVRRNIENSAPGNK